MKNLKVIISGYSKPVQFTCSEVSKDSEWLYISTNGKELAILSLRSIIGYYWADSETSESGSPVRPNGHDIHDASTRSTTRTNA